jgi:eukaryotic-like serine/threonine-protein kinase
LIRAIDAAEPQPWFIDAARATVMLAMRDTAGALTSLERSSSTTGWMWSEYLPASDPAYDPVRKSARFAALVRQAGLDSRVITAPRGPAMRR